MKPPNASWPNMLRMLCTAMVLGCNGIVTMASDMQISLRWPHNTYVWRYNPKHKPDWLGEDEALTVVRNVAASWDTCGISLPYAGLTNKVPGNIDGENVVGWREDGRNFSAWTTWAACTEES